MNPFMTKNGFAVTQIAAELLNVTVGERIPRISDFSEKWRLGRGTVQNALRFIEEQQGIKLENRGHMGTFVLSMNLMKLWNLAGFQSVLGTMPLPYSRRFEGLATAFYEAFDAAKISFNMAYVRGGMSRYEGLLRNRYDFAVCSRKAKEKYGGRQPDLEIAIPLGSYSYVGGHVILCRDGSEPDQPITPRRVGIDPNSQDQCEIARAVFRHGDDVFVETHYTQIIPKIQNGELDATIWNLDELTDRTVNLKQLPLPITDEALLPYTEAVVVVNKKNPAIERILREVVDVNEIRRIQEAVLGNHFIPRY